MIQFRQAHAGDIPAVDAMLRRSYPRLMKGHYPPSVLVTAIPRIARAQPQLVTCGTYFVADRDGEILASGGWTRARAEGAETGHMRHFVTHDRFARQGIGRALGRHVLEDARATGIRDMTCLATLMAVPFYEALGFARIGALEVHLCRHQQNP